MGGAVERPGRAHSPAQPRTLSLTVVAVRETSYGCGPLVTNSYDDEVCSEFQLFRLCGRGPPLHRRPSSE